MSCLTKEYGKFIQKWGVQTFVQYGLSEYSSEIDRIYR